MTIHLRACQSVLCVAAFLVAVSLNANGADPVRPNVIVIMADDIGAEGLAT